MKTSTLLSIVGSVLLAEIIYLSAWLFSEPGIKSVIQTLDPIRPGLNWTACVSQHAPMYIIIGLKAGMLLGGCILSFKIRNFPAR